MNRTRICLMVEIDLDPTPGTFHTPASAREQVERMLTQAVGHYCPTVELTAHAPVHESVYDLSLRRRVIADSLSRQDDDDCDPWDWQNFRDAVGADVALDLYNRSGGSLGAAMAMHVAESDGQRVAVSEQIFKLTTLNSVYELVLRADGTGTITRQGGSNPYQPPEYNRRPCDGEPLDFTNGAFVDRDGFEYFEWGELGPLGLQRPYYTSPIKTKEVVA